MHVALWHAQVECTGGMYKWDGRMLHVCHIGMIVESMYVTVAWLFVLVRGVRNDSL